jgi:bifunctional non-homologous end joining protein LigD
MLAGVVGIPADAAARMVEPKWDGVRVIVTVTEGRARFSSRNANDVTGAYPELEQAPANVSDAVLDGEVIALDDDGHSSFGRLQRRMHVRRPPPRLLTDVPVHFAVFDLLWLDGRLLIDLAQRERRRRLDALGLHTGGWVTSPVLDASPDALPDTAHALGLEGFVLKRPDAPYLPGRRSPAWAKVKMLRRREFVVGGWLEGRGGGVGSLAVGVWERDRRGLRYMGMVGSGLKPTGAAALDGLARAESPFAGPTPPGVRFLEPVLVAEVTFSEVTGAGTLRHPVLVGFRTDKDPADVVADDELG